MAAIARPPGVDTQARIDRAAPALDSRSARPHDALQVLIDESWRGRRWVVETDIASCFEAIRHDRLIEAVEERVCDRKVLKLLRAMLRAGVMEDGVIRGAVTGTPQQRGDDTSNAVANFEFSVSLPYRRGEKLSRASSGGSTTPSDV